MFPLEHFYYGQLAHHGKPQKNMRLLAKSAQITDEQVAEAVRFALASPSSVLEQGSWALVRGRRTPFFIVQSQKGSAGQLIMHYIVMPSDVLRSMTGNVKAISELIQDKLPVYNQLGNELVPVTLPNPDTVPISEQVDGLLDLMTYTKNKMSTIENLIASIIKGLPLIIINAPKDPNPRVSFIHGLLTLLPSSTRYGVTFATSSDSKTQMNLQMRFIDGGRAPSGSIIYDWESGKIEGKVPKDEYSHFIISQFRLDATLVIQQTETLTPIAGWRFRNGDSLAAALAYASYRTKIDKSVTTNQPVEVSDVSKVLSDDPTLTPELRVSYSRHLINLSLAIEDMQFAEPVAVMLHNNESLARDIHKQMSNALNDGLAYLIYETLFNWMGHPLGPQGQSWIELTYKAALTYLDELIEDQDHEGIDEYVDSIQSAPTGVAVGKVVPDVLKKLMPQIDQNNQIAMPLFSLAIQHIPKDELSKVLNNATLRTYMSQTMLNFLSHLFNQQMPPAPPGTLMAAVESLSTKSRKDALLKFTEMAKDNQRTDLIDAEVLQGLFNTTQSSEPIDHIGFLLQLTNDLIEGNIKQLTDAGPQYLLQILYALHQYDLLAKNMIKISRDFFGIDRQFDYIAMVQKLYASVKVTANEATTVLVSIRRNGIKGLPYLTASVGILEGTDWSNNLEQIAEQSIIIIEENPRFLEVIQPATILGILEYYIRQKNIDKAIEIGQFVPDVAANREEAGPATIRRMLKMMNRDRRARAMSFEYLRSYIRKAESSIARKAIRHFGQGISEDARRKLEVSYVMSRFFGGVDLITYSELLEFAVDLLKDTAEAYHNNRPTTGDLQRMLDNIRIGFDVDDREMMGQTLVEVGKAIVSLYEQQRSAGGRGVTGRLRSPDKSRSILDMFVVISSVAGNKQRYPSELERFTDEYPFRKRTGLDILDHADITNNILRAPMIAMPLDKPIKYVATDIEDEVESRLLLIPHDERDTIRQSIAENLQNLVFLVNHIGKAGDSRALSDSTLSSRLDEAQRPRSTLELYRYMYGYFNS
jgi:hypothetical protein